MGSAKLNVIASEPELFCEGIRNSVFEAYLEKEEICRRTEGMRKKGCKAG